MGRRIEKCSPEQLGLIISSTTRPMRQRDDPTDRITSIFDVCGGDPPTFNNFESVGGFFLHLTVLVVLARVWDILDATWRRENPYIRGVRAA